MLACTELLRTILERPADDAPRLVYADWLDENDLGIHDLGLRAAFIRWQIQGTWGGVPFQPRYATDMPYNLAWFTDKRHLWSADRMSKLIYAAAGSLQQGDPKFGSYSWNHEETRVVRTETNGVRLTYRRGFVESVSMPTAAFLGCAAELFRCQPVTSVKLTDAVIFESSGASYFYVGGLGQLPSKYWKDLDRLPSRLAGIAALSSVCVALGREAAGLSS